MRVGLVFVLPLLKLRPLALRLGGIAGGLELSREDGLAGSVDLALLVLEILAGAVLFAGLAPDQAHAIADAVADDRVAFEPGQLHVMEETAAARGVVSFRSFWSCSGSLAAPIHPVRQKRH